MHSLKRNTEAFKSRCKFSQLGDDPDKNVVKITTNGPWSPPPSLLSLTIFTTIQMCTNRWQQNANLIGAGVFCFAFFLFLHICKLAGEQLPAASHSMSLAVARTESDAIYRSRAALDEMEAPCYLQNSRAGSTYISATSRIAQTWKSF